MKSTRENVIKLTEKLIEMREAQAMNKENEKAVQDFDRHNAMGMKTILRLLTDQEYFNSLWEIWEDEIE